MLRPMQRVVTTASVEPTQRVAFWTDLVCDTYVQLECDAPAGARAIDGEIEIGIAANDHRIRAA